jgi:outer membrane protein assembly factor BamB
VFEGPLCGAGDPGVFGAEAVATVGTGSSARTLLFVPCQAGTVAVSVTGGTTPSFTKLWAAPGVSPSGSPVIAGGLVFALDWRSNQVVAMSPSTGTVRFVRSSDPLNHFATPTVALGHVLVPTRSGVEAFTVGF